MGPGGFKPGVGRWQSFPDPLKIFWSLSFFWGEICQLERSPIAIALWAAGKAPEKLTAFSQGCLEGKIKKNNFSGSEKLFFEICQLEGSPIAIALWAAGKAPEKLTACSQGCLERKIKKTTFQALKDCFLKFASRKGLPLQLRFGKFAQCIL